MSAQYEQLIKKTKLEDNSEYYSIWSPCGKRYQAKYLVKKQNSFQISTGDLLRDEIKKDPKLEK